MLTSLIKPIPKRLRDDLAADSFYGMCCIADRDCTPGIEWHHHLLYAGRRVNAKFCILPVCPWHHARARLKVIKEKLDRVMLSRATDEDLATYPRVPWQQLKQRLRVQ